MGFLIRINSRYYYNRRVPEEVQEYDPRTLIRVALKTDSREQATRKALILNEQVEAYWQNLIADNVPHDNVRFKRTVNIARKIGFGYQPMSIVATLPIIDLLERVLALKDATGPQIEAVLGGKPVPQITVSQALERYWPLTKDKVMNKTELQVKKWQNPRKKAVENFVLVRGDKNLKDITRDDIVAFRDWWIDRVKVDGKNEDSANKNLMQLKAVLDTVSDHEKLGLEIEHLFKKVKLKTRFYKKRLPFTSDQIRAILENPALQNMNEDARWFLFAMAETGARPSELVGLLPEDIVLNVDIPYISITDRKERPLKNVFSQRQIPLVGYALDAFKAMPGGFARYRDRPDSLTTAVNSFLRANKMLPTENHSVYSLRHSFQDRILKAKAPDRVQTDLMGHKFKDRIDYGLGSDMELKLEYLENAKLKYEKTNCG